MARRTTLPVVPDRSRVMVVHGRNELARRAMFGFLAILGLRPVNWDDAVAGTGEGTPHNLTAVRAAMAASQATVVLLTADEVVRLHPALDPRGEEQRERRQARPNVLLEAGMAFATRPEHTIIVELGRIDRATDLDGLNAVRMDGGAAGRTSLRKRLIRLGCGVDESSTEYLVTPSPEDFARAIELTASGVADRSPPQSAHARAAIARRLRIFLDAHRSGAAFEARELQASLGVGWEEREVRELLEELVRAGGVERVSGSRYRTV